MIFIKMFSRKWLFTTILVLLGTALCIRLGIWQFDRLAQRRVFNAQVISMRAAPMLDLNQAGAEDISKMEWRPVQVTGKYDFENQVAIRNQYYGSQYGYHLITPLLLTGASTSLSAEAVLVDRGWIPADGNAAPADWRRYDEPGEVKLEGQIRLGQTKPVFGGVADAIPTNGGKLDVWNNLDLVNISKQNPYPLLPIYVQPNADVNDSEPPVPSQPELDLTEGSHFGYALQWFSFAAILFVGYPFFLRKRESEPE